MRRYQYDKSHFALVDGKIGRLQTLATIPHVGGESYEINLGGLARLSALRRQLTLDARVELFVFDVPHRHVYGDDWVNLIKQGIDETVTLTTGPTHSEQGYFGTKLKGIGYALPLWMTAGYNRIWNRYFRAPTDVSGEVADSYIAATGTSQVGKYGFNCARLKAPHSTGIDGTVDSSDREVASVSVVDIVDFKQMQARYKSELERDFFAQYYSDVMANQFGGKANPDSDERPYLLMRQVNSLSGYDVDGTDDASLGTFSGKSAAQVGLRMPMRYMPEHGVLWIMALVRFPNVWQRERHYLVDKSQPTYKEIAGDPEIVGAEPPEQLMADDWFETAGAVDLGRVPYGQWYRHHPNYVHKDFETITGFPFQLGPPSTHDQARYHADGDYDEAFQTLQLAHWQITANVAVKVKSPVPSAASSIFAGAN